MDTKARFESVDKVQQLLVKEVFGYAKDKKKAAGRALGTLVEIISYYTLCSWGFRDQLAIERAVPEYGNADITHNVEFSLHPLLRQDRLTNHELALPISCTKLRKASRLVGGAAPCTSNQVISSLGVRRNSCVLGQTKLGFITANIDSYDGSKACVQISELHKKPFAIFECKRVGVEEGMKKGPQSIEKAKQGAYVARTISSLQKIRTRDGERHGYVDTAAGAVSGSIEVLIDDIIRGEDRELLSDFVLTVGMVSNHGNWFTAEDHNKELKVLAQSYDWLVFLTDAGLTQFIDKLLLSPVPELVAAKEAFLATYNADRKGGTRFTKVLMDNDADAALQAYFRSHEQEVESWFNVIAPSGGALSRLKDELKVLCEKRWEVIHER